MQVLPSCLPPGGLPPLRLGLAWFPWAARSGLLPPGLAGGSLLGPWSQGYVDNPTPATVGQPPRQYCGLWGQEDYVSGTSPHNQGPEGGHGGPVGGDRGLRRLEVGKAALIREPG